MERTAELIRRSQDGDKEARDTLIQENMDWSTMWSAVSWEGERRPRI